MIGACSSFNNDIYPGGYLAKCGGRLEFFFVIYLVIYWFGIGSFLGEYIVGDIILLFFIGIYFSGITLAPVPSYKIETLVHILSSTIISFGADGSDWPIKFCALVTFYVLIDSLGVLFLT